MIYHDYAFVVLFFVAALLFGIITLAVAKLVRPYRPNPEKYTTYECGEIPVGVAWVQFNISYYIFALIFVIFDVETIFIYPWAVLFKKLGFPGLIEMGIFIGILLLGLIYAWKKGVLKWV